VKYAGRATTRKGSGRPGTWLACPQRESKYLSQQVRADRPPARFPQALAAPGREGTAMNLRVVALSRRQTGGARVFREPLGRPFVLTYRDTGQHPEM
jgi:hypothetical protein